MDVQPRASSPWVTPPFCPAERHSIDVIGEGTVAAAPDKATIVLGAVTEQASLTEAQSENARAVAHIVEALRKLSVPKENMQTVQYSIDMQYDYPEGVQTFRGYKVTHMLQITVDSIERTGLIVDTAVQNGANSVSNIQFAVANPQMAYSSALSAAIQDARLHAMAIARAIGVRLHPVPLQVQELTRTQGPVPYPSSATVFAKLEATPVQPGEQEIHAMVKARFTCY